MKNKIDNSEYANLRKEMASNGFIPVAEGFINGNITRSSGWTTNYNHLNDDYDGEPYIIHDDKINDVWTKVTKYDIETHNFAIRLDTMGCVDCDKITDKDKINEIKNYMNENHPGCIIRTRNGKDSIAFIFNVHRLNYKPEIFKKDEKLKTDFGEFEYLTGPHTINVAGFHRTDVNSHYVTTPNIFDTKRDSLPVLSGDDIEKIFQFILRGKLGKFQAHRKTIADCMAVAAPVWLIEDFWFQNQIANLYSDTNVGKTFVALDIALSVASGRAWQGKAVTRSKDSGEVVYIASEAPRSVMSRAAEWSLINQVPLSKLNDFIVIDTPIDIASTDDTRDFIAQQTNPVEIVIIDTLAASMASNGNENDATEMSRVVNNAREIANTLNCAVLILHHTGKLGTVERGSHAYKCGIDTSIKLEIEGKVNDTDIIHMTVEKQRDGDFSNIHLLKNVVDVTRNGITGTTIKLDTYNKVAANSQADIKMWDDIADILKQNNNLTLTRILTILNGGKNPSGNAIKKLQNKFIDGVLSIGTHTFEIYDKKVSLK